ncbi:acetyl-CoA synthetase-like protein [Mytilinidion resinicola]|uniref:Acetyl-CoA synthetase-like protein n=1 Tax=Mytilinidion resinicola TaxID=574789 RepID=A0A6A6YL35_9PEZI|nr:acetyl-CoA synthetase-like protein [Mytilinidion resinicola]KAF2809259.1 acetyl-CoA synthetase-like protein [Mytilinidion resinicola]
MPEDRCYIVYTSGSTGKPKGAVLTHGAAANGIVHYALSGLSRWLLFYNPTFSAAQRTMLSTLIHGGTLLTASKNSLSTDLAGVIDRNQIDALGITPSALTLLKPSDIRSVRLITLVGEHIPESLVRIWAGIPNVKLRNTYGLSECTQLNFGRTLAVDSSPCVVGTPNDTTMAYVIVPGNLHLAPVGVAGELCLAGPQLAAGYLNLPELTAAKFLLGRLDLQIKVNGQRVDPTEVDGVLRTHSAVVSCASVGTTVDGHLALVAAVVLHNGLGWSDAVPLLLRHMRATLPAYMVPTLWLPLEEIPTTASGKVNFDAIQTMAIKRGTAGFAELLARPGVEEEVLDSLQLPIARAWADVLGIDYLVIRRHHSLLMLGGNSIIAIQAVAKLRSEGIVVEFSSFISDESLEEVASTAKIVSVDHADVAEPFSLIEDSGVLDDLRQHLNIEDAYPATSLQAGLLTTLNGETDACTYRRVWNATGMNTERMRQSFQQVFEERDILRTGFVADRKPFIQFVRLDLDLPWSEVQCSLEEYMDRDRQLEMPISGPLFRVGFISGKYLVVTMHHSLFDFRSHWFLYEDVAAAYLGKKIPRRPKFRHFVRYLVDRDSVSAQKTCLNFAPISLPCDSFISPGTPPQEVPQRVVGVSKQTSNISKDLSISLVEKAKLLGVSLGAIVYSAWAILLSRHLGNSDITFAATVSGREVPVLDVQSIDGPTMVTVPQRIQIETDQSLIRLAKASMTGFARMTKHSQYGMQEALRSGNLQPGCFDTIVNILVSNEASDDAQKVFRRYGDRPIWGSDFTLLEVEEGKVGTNIRLSSDMESRRLDFICDSFVKIVTTMLEEPESRVSTLDILGDAERSYLSDTLSSRHTLRTPEAQMLHAEFERHANLSPNMVAIDWDATRDVTYAVLNSLANQLAHLLIEHGVIPGDVVALILDKSVATIISILGVLKASGAYVPLNPEHPPERNRFIIQNYNTRVMIIHEAYDLQTVVFERAAFSSRPTEKPLVATTPQHLAYVIYTSGSTGQPKGVKVPHHTVATAIASMADVEGQHEGGWRTLQFSNYVFYATGGTLCMAPMERLMFDITSCINVMRVQKALLMPTVANLFGPEQVPTFEKLLSGGEPLTHSILNLYGPTETSILVTAKSVREGSRVTNIGAPFPTVMAFIVDPDGEELRPYGASGELCIAGPQVTAGYMNRDDLTAVAFRDSIALEVRIYRTGDLARWLPGGEIECLGRKDNQVKINGHRIELGEIEHAIRRTSLVIDVVVLLVNVASKAQLVALCVFEVNGRAQVQPAENNREHLRALRDQLDGLATYMVPKVVIPMGDFPRMASHKVDRKALKGVVEELGGMAINGYALEMAGEHGAVIAAETPMERALERMWAGLFHVPATQIGREANFLALGGDSISAISLASTARHAGFRLSVPSILKFSKLKDLAGAMQEVEKAEVIAQCVFEVVQEGKDAIQAMGLSWEEDVEYVFPCPPGQAEFLNQGNRPEQMWVLQTVRHMSAGVDQERWIRATTKLSKANDILRTVWIKLVAKGWVGVVLKSSELNLVKFNHSGDAEAVTIIDEFWKQPFAAGKPFIKYAILDHPDNSWDLAIKMDHAVYDGTLLRVFDDHFRTILQDQAIPRHGQFKDFAFHNFQSDKVRSLSYWKGKMAHKPTKCSPAGWVSTSAPMARASLRRLLEIPDIETKAKLLGVTPSIIFQGAFQLWLSRATRNTSTSFDYLVSGRNVTLPDPQNINGTLANFLPVVATVDHSTTVKKFLEQAQDDFWAMTEYGNVGLDDIYDAANVSRKDAGNQILFLSQPFEVAAKGNPNAAFRWLVLAESKLSKAPGNQHKITLMQISDEIADLIDAVLDDQEEGIVRRIGDIIDFII